MQAGWRAAGPQHTTTVADLTAGARLLPTTAGERSTGEGRCKSIRLLSADATRRNLAVPHNPGEEIPGRHHNGSTAAIPARHPASTAAAGSTTELESKGES